jgi:hypothetical protein
VVAKNPTTGEVILIAHVKIGEGKKGLKTLKENMKRMRENGTVWIGQIGGKGGDTKRGIHSHLTFFPSEKSRLDATAAKREVQKKFQLGDYPASSSKDLGNFRNFLK